MGALWRRFRAWPAFARFVVGGTALCGLVGAAAGLALGLHTYIPTAWAAVFEVGVPAAAMGAALGALAHGVVILCRRARRSGMAQTPGS